MGIGSVALGPRDVVARVAARIDARCRHIKRGNEEQAEGKQGCRCPSPKPLRCCHLLDPFLVLLRHCEKRILQQSAGEGYGCEESERV